MDIYAFSAYRAYLQAWRDDPQRKISQSELARRSKCSKSLLSQIVNGTRDLHPARAPALSAALEHDAEEARYFEDLLVAEHGLSLAVRRAARGRIASARRLRHGPRITHPQARMLSRWYFPAVAELARCAGFRPDPAWIAATLVPSISEIEAEEALALLLEIGVLVPTDDRGVALGAPTWSTGHEAEEAVSDVVRGQHLAVLDLAARALGTVPWELRQYDTMTLATSLAAIPELKRRLASFVYEMAEISERHPPEIVVHLGVQLFPLSLSALAPAPGAPREGAG